MRKSTKTKIETLGADSSPEDSAEARKAANAEAELQPLRPALEALVTPNLAVPPTIAQANVAAANPSLFSLANIRVDQAFATTPGLVDLPMPPVVRRPSKQEFFRVNPDPAYKLPAAILVDEDDDKTAYLLLGGIHLRLAGEFRLVNLRLLVTLSGTRIIFPVTIPGWNGEVANKWHLSAENAVAHGERQWTRMRAVKQAQGYQLTVADGALAAQEPRWPTETFDELIQLAFADKYIDNLQHPLVQRLFGHA